MTEDQETKSLIPTKWIAENYPFLESASIAFCVISFLLKVFDVDGWAMAVVISYTFYAMLTYLGAFLPRPSSHLFITALCKISYIATAVGVVGLCFALVGFPGAKNILVIGAATMALSAVLLFLISLPAKHNTPVKIILRSLIISIFAAAYLLYAPALL